MLHTSLLRLLMWPVLWPAHLQAVSPPAEVPSYNQDRTQSGSCGMIQAGDVAVGLARSAEDTGQECTQLMAECLLQKLLQR